MCSPPHLLLKLRDVEISEIKFTAALVASNKKKTYLILHKQNRGMFGLVGKRKEFNIQTVREAGVLWQE